MGSSYNVQSWLSVKADTLGKGGGQVRDNHSQVALIAEYPATHTNILRSRLHGTRKLIN